MSQCTLCYFISSEMKFTLNITKLFAFSQLNTLSIWNYSARSYQGPSASSLHFQHVASHIRLTHSTNVPGDMTSTNLFSNILSFDIDSIELNCIKKKAKSVLKIRCGVRGQPLPTLHGSGSSLQKHLQSHAISL